MTNDAWPVLDQSPPPEPSGGSVDTAAAPPHTGQPAIDTALARFVERLPDGLEAHVEAGAHLDQTLRAQLADLDPGARA